MNMALDIITFLICTIIVVGSLLKIQKRVFNVLDVCIVVYWIMQVLPIIVQMFTGLESVQSGVFPYLYLAMTDTTTALLYNFITITTIVVMALFAKKMKRNNKNESISKLKRFLNNSIIKSLVLIGVFVPLILSVVLSPDPSVYFTYSYFYTNAYDVSGASFLFHNNIVNRLCFVTVLFVIILYFSRSKRNILNNLDVIFAIVACTWINGKRAILIFLLFGILAVDFMDFSMKKKKLIFKGCVFGAISLLYFYSFSLVTGKQAGSDFFDLYNMYFSRLGCEKLSIYDRLYTNKMLDYPGQTILYDLFFFVPREIWSDKPSFFACYFTAYAYRGDGRSYFLPSNLLVNIWTEFYSNFGIFGHFIALLIIVKLAKYAEKSKSYLVYLSTTLFLVAYMSFGFEFIVLIIYAAMVGSIILNKISSFIYPKRRKMNLINKGFYY